MEVDVQAEIMCEATRLGHRLMRNNVGKSLRINDDGTERWTAFGVGGKGGSDLVGFTKKRIYVLDNRELRLMGPRDIVPPPRDLRFYDFPIATYIECKKLKGAKRKKQIEFIDAMLKHGCIAGFCFSVEDYRKLVGAQ